MKVIVRLYWQHDFDLVTMANCDEIRMGKLFKAALIAWANNDIEFKIEAPDFSYLSGYNAYENYITSFSLNPKKDAEAIKALRSIRSGYRNAALKVLFRSYLSNAMMEPFLTETEINAKRRGADKTNTKTNAVFKTTSDALSPSEETMPKSNKLVSTNKKTKEKVVENTEKIKKEEDSLKSSAEEGFDLFAAVDNILGE